MPGDAFKKVRPGQALSIPAEAWNASLDAARAHRNQRHVRSTAEHVANDPDVILVRNDTGAARDRFDVVGLGDPVVLPADNLAEFKNNVILKGLEPAAEHAGRFGILQEPVPVDGLGRAIVSGVTPCRFNDDPGDFEFAGIKAAEFGLEAGQGASQILWADTSDLDGEWWGIVRLGVVQGFVLGKTDASHDVGDSGTVSVYSGTKGSESDTGDNITAYNRFADLESGDWVICIYLNGGWELVAADPC